MDFRERLITWYFTIWARYFSPASINFNPRNSPALSCSPYKLRIPFQKGRYPSFSFGSQSAFR